jgi:transcription elongation factor Elf1
MPNILRTAKFRCTDTPAQILEDLACPACGSWDPLASCSATADNKIRIFCEGCGAFITIELSDEQADAIHRSRIAGRTDASRARL